MQAELKTKWLDALRSGQYEQGDGALRQYGKYCCLGVLCDISKLGKWVDNDTACDLDLSVETGGDAYVVGEGDDESYSDVYLPSALYETIGLTSEQAHHLANLNDNGNSFAEIADVIEAEVPVEAAA